MSIQSNLFLALAMAAALSSGCAPAGGPRGDHGEEGEAGSARQGLEVPNAHSMNGTAVNGTYHNGIKHNGIKHNGIKHNGIKHNGMGLESIAEDTGLTVSGTGHTGADMDGELGDGTPVTVHIESVSENDVPGMYTYEITLDGTNICGEEGAMALIVPGGWDYDTATYIEDETTFTIACLGAAIAKCTEWGYKSWGVWTEDNGTDTQEVPLHRFHEACVRMVRADYCGDGVSHTEDGTLIEIYDTAGIQTETPGNLLPLEAEWAANGATCVRHVRWTQTDALPEQDVEDYIAQHCPSRWAGPGITSCGSATSEYFTANGFTSSPPYAAPHATRPLLRNASEERTH